MKVKIYDDNDNLIDEGSGELLIVAVADYDDKEKVVRPTVMGSSGRYEHLARLYLGMGRHLHDKLQGILDE